MSDIIVQIQQQPAIQVNIIDEANISVQLIEQAPIQVTIDYASPGRDGIGIPSGGNALQILRKKTNTDYDTEWASGGGGASVWGGISGTLSDQTDLQNALNSKSNTNHNHNLNDLAEKSYNSLTDKPVIISASQAIAFAIALG